MNLESNADQSSTNQINNSTITSAATSLGTAVVPSGEDMASLWASYTMGMKKTPSPVVAAAAAAAAVSQGSGTPLRESSPPNGGGEAGSAHDETSSSGNKEDEDDDDEDVDERLDPRHHDPERLKAFNVSI